MNQHFTIEHYVQTGELSKQASVLSARQECQDIMNTIRQENPSYWPYGLSVAGHDALYIIRDNMTKAAAGFVGWQESTENFRRIGSYSIGILPQYRGRGFAKEAVAKIIQEKSAGVDEVRAYVMNHNAPSKALAASLSVPVHTKF